MKAPQSRQKPLKKFAHNVAILKDTNPTYPYRVHFTAEGKRQRKYFRLKKEAEAFAAEKAEELDLIGSQSAAHSLSEAELGALREELPYIRESGFTLRNALEHFRRHIQLTSSSKTVEAAAADFLLEKELSPKVNELALRDYRARIGRFSKAFESQSVALVTTDQVREWLYSLRVSSVTLDNYRRALSTFFIWAEAKGWCEGNPAHKRSVDLPEIDDAEIGILEPSEFAALMAAAPPPLVPYIAMATLAGIRVDGELQRLEWKAVNLRTGVIHISASVAKRTKKGGRKRQIPISENLREWLLTCKPRTGKVAPPNSRRLMDAARVRAGFKPSHFSTDPETRKIEESLKDWPRNAMRHSFASYRMAETMHEGIVAEEMGNSPSIVQRHYKALVTREDAEEFWNIGPEAIENIVTMTA
ncbi:MAG: tyrosine-type recombinase/integrase [Verrucomicrobiae bacterium]|nr:tyrosine-type recombinase/integrase [Verrucomicrobiae bacterium]